MGVGGGGEKGSWLFRGLWSTMLFTCLGPRIGAGVEEAYEVYVSDVVSLFRTGRRSRTRLRSWQALCWQVAREHS